MLGLYGGIRCDELVKLRVNDLKKEGNLILINVLETKTKVPRKFVIMKPEFITLIEKYQRLRLPNMTSTDRFFVSYYHNRLIPRDVILTNEPNERR